MAHSREELEIKLRGAPGDIAALRHSRLFSDLRDGKGAWERLVSTYYDTPEGVLAKAGGSLRLREEAGRLIQTVKLKRGEGGTLCRDEEELELGCADDFPKTEGGALDALIKERGEALAPVARTVTDRWSVMLDASGARIEAALDLGRAEAFRKGEPLVAAPLAEAEFELIEGAPKELFKLARLCLEEAEGRLSLVCLSKEEQARRLVGGGPAVAPEPRLELDKDANVGDVLAAALMSSALRVIDLAPSVTALRMPEGVHQMRVALRRLRAVEKVFRPAANSNDLKKLARRARRFAQALGLARDWDVFLETTLPGARALASGMKGFDVIAARAEMLRAEAWQGAAETIGGLSFNKFALDLLAAAHLQKWRKGAGAALDEPARDFAARALDVRLADAHALADGADALQPAARHPLRIALKKLRYAAQTFRSLYPRSDRKAYMAAMSRLQDALGAVNDAVVAQGLSEDASQGEGAEAARAAGFICGYRAAEAKEASRAIEQSWAAFAAMTPFWRRDK